MKQSLKNILKFSLPSNRQEKKVFFLFGILYSLLSIFLVFTTDIVEGESSSCNLYFGLDTQIFIHKFFSVDSTSHLMDAAHPILRLILLPVILVAAGVEFLLGVKAKSLFLVLISSSLVSASLMQIYRYLRTFLSLNKYRSGWIITVAGFFSTNLILSFTPESYPLSLYLLTFFFVYSSFLLKEKKALSVFELTFFAVITAGTTLTNGVKNFIPELFTSFPLKEKLLRIFKAGLLVLGVLVAYYVFLIPLMHFLKGELYFPWVDAVTALPRYNTADAYPAAICTSWWKMALVYFWGSPMLFSSIIENIHSSGVPQMLTGTYAYFLQYVWVALALISLLYIFIRNYKNKFVLILVLSFCIDVIIHLVLNYGIYESFIYGGHWVFIVPMLWGWLYQGKENKKLFRFWDVFLITIGIALILNNIHGMAQFVQFALRNYPTV